SDGRSGLPAEGDAAGGQRTGSWGTAPYDPAAPATSARSSRPGGRTSLGVDSFLVGHRRRNGPASSPAKGHACLGLTGAGASDTRPGSSAGGGRTGSSPLPAAPNSCLPATCPTRG